MASQVLSGNSNPTYTNNTGQNVRIVINYMSANPTDNEITINWAGVSVTETNVEAIGKNIACASSFYGDYFWFTSSKWNWWKKIWDKGLNPRAALNTQNVAVKMPILDVDFTNKKRFKQWLIDNSYLSGFSFSVALPLEIFLAPGQTFSAVCGQYNIVAIKEDGN